MPCLLRDVPVGYSAKMHLYAQPFWVLVTGRVRNDMMVRGGMAGDGAPWVCDGSMRVDEIKAPARIIVDGAAVHDPVTGVADMGPLFAARQICPECGLRSPHETTNHKPECSRGV